MESLPQTENADTGARGISEILAKANRADLPAMRTSLSFLTSAGAQLATALQRRNQEYDEALAALSMLPPEWVQAARSGQALPDLRLLRSELEQAKEQSAHFEAQLTERGQLVQALQAQLETAAAAKSQTEAELANLEEQMNALSVELQQSLAEDEAAASPTDDEAAGTQTRAIEPSALDSASGGKRVALTAAVAAVAAQSHRKHEELDALNAQVVDLQSLIDALTSDKQALEALLTDMQAQLDAATAELTDTDQQLSGLQSDLQASLGEGVPAPAPVAAADAAVPAEAAAPAEAVAPVDAAAPAEAGGQEAPADVEPQAAPVEVVAAAPETEAAAEQVDTPQVHRAATRIALASAISAAIARNRDQQTALVESKVQLADLQVQFDAASCAQVEDEAELNDLENQLDTLNGQLQPLLVDDTAPVAAEAAPAEAADAGLQEEAAAQPVDGQPPADAAVTPEPSPVETPQTRRTVKRAALAAAIAAVIARVNKKQADLETSQAQLADLQVQFDAASSAQAEDEAELNDLENQLDVLNGQLQPILVDEATPAAAEATPAEGGDAGLDAGLQEEAAAQPADAQPSADAAETPEPSPDKPSLMRRAATSVTSTAAMAANELGKQVSAFNSKLLSTPAADTAPAEAADAAPPADAAATPEPSPVETPQTRRTAKRAALAAAIAAVVARVNKKQAELETSQAQLADLQAQLDAATTAKAETEAQLAALEHQVNGVTSELEPLVAEEGGETPAAGAEETPADGISAKGAALGATAAAAVASSTKKQKELEEAQAQLTDLQAKLDAATAAQADTEAKLAGVEKQLDALAAELQPLEGTPAVATAVEGEVPAGGGSCCRSHRRRRSGRG